LPAFTFFCINKQFLVTFRELVHADITFFYGKFSKKPVFSRYHSIISNTVLNEGYIIIMHTVEFSNVFAKVGKNASPLLKFFILHISRFNCKIKQIDFLSAGKGLNEP